MNRSIHCLFDLCEAINCVFMFLFIYCFKSVLFHIENLQVLGKQRNIYGAEIFFQKFLNKPIEKESVLEGEKIFFKSQLRVN